MPASGAVVLIDATAIPVDRGGVGRYVEELIAALDGPVHVAIQRRDVERFRRIAPRATLHPQSKRIASVAARLLWEQTALPRLARRIGADVVHSPHYTIPLLYRGARVVTFHDATFFSDPAVHSRTKRLFFRFWCRWSSRRADAVIVPSSATASEFERFLPRAASDFDVAHHGVDPVEFSPPDASEIAAADLAVGADGRPWITFLGTIEPRKNVPALVRAYARLAETSTADPFPLLVLAGAQGWEHDLDEAIASVRGPGEVVRLGFVPGEALTGLLGGSVVVVYPSLGEGFGLPVLEAMATGAPVLTTRRLALPEVGGDAVDYSDVDDESIAASLRALLGDPARRAELSVAGRRRAAAFTWAASAARHRSVYDRVAGVGAAR